MKRFLPWLLVLVFLMEGCQKPEIQQHEVTSPEETTAEVRTVMAEQEKNRELIREIPCKSVESAVAPCVEPMGENLLVWYMEASGTEGARLHMTLLEGTEGKELEKCAVEVSYDAMPQVLDNGVAIWDPDPERVMVFDGDLELTNVYTLGKIDGGGYADPQGKNLYVLDWDRGIYEIEMETGKETPILPSIRRLKVYGCQNHMVFLGGEDLESGRHMDGALDLSTGAVTRCPFSRCLGGLSGADGLWLGNQGSESCIGAGKHPASLSHPDWDVRMLPDGRLLFKSWDEEKILICENDGTYVTQVSLPEGMTFSWRENSVFAWEEGYLLTALDGKDHGHLFYLDATFPTEGKDVDITMEEEEQGGATAEPELYDRAKEISDTYGVKIRIADQCGFAYPSFTATELTDTLWISQGLTMVEDALSSYPENFFRQLPYGTVDEIQISLVSDLTAADGFGGDGGYCAITYDDGSSQNIILDVHSAVQSTIYHEVSHILDEKLLYHAGFQEEPAFSEEQWQALQPEGFSYSYDYAQVPTLNSDTYGWFIDGYSGTFPTEDRARVLEYAMDDHMWQDAYKDAPHLLDKLAYYSAAIRAYFDTTGWEEVTDWEIPLEHYGWK